MEIEDIKLIKKIKHRNTRGIEGLITKYTSTVAALVFRIIGTIGNQEDIDECVSDIFMKIWNDIGEYNSDKGSFKTWLLIKSKYTALDYRRSILRRTNREIASKETEDTFSIELNKSINSEIEEKMIHKENYQTLLKAINDLKEPEREMIKRRYFLYESIESIAKQFNLSRAAVDNKLYRARKTLKKVLVEEGCR